MSVLRFLALAIVTLFSSLQAVAQMLPPTDADDEIVVVGARAPTNREALGNAITVLDEEFIAARGALLVSDLLRTVPGVEISRSGPLGSLTQARLRGAEGNHTLVLIDGVPANDPLLGDEFNFAHLLTDNIVRIEILKGPQSALYGSDAIGGVINIITRTGQGPLNANLYAEGGSFGTVRLGAGIGASKDIFNFAASVGYLDSRGTDASPTGNEKDGYENFTLNAQAGLRPSEIFGLNASLRFVDSTVEADIQDFDFLSPTFGQVVDADEAAKNQQFLVAVQGDLSLFDGRWLQDIAFSYSDHDNEFLTDGAVTSTLLSDRLKFRYQSALQVRTTNTAHRFTGAVEYEETRFESRAPDPLSPSNQTKHNEQLSFAGEYRLDLWQDLHLSGSIRHDDNDIFANATSWNLTAAQVIRDGATRFHASVGKAVANPGFFELFGFIPGSFIPNPDLIPERSLTIDFGVEQKFLDNQLVIDLTYFNSDLKNEITTVFDFVDDMFISTPVNEDGTSKRQGIEFAASAIITEAFSVNGSYTYLDAREPEDESGDRAREVRRAKHIASLGGDFIFHDGRGRVHLGLDYNGKQQDLNFFVFPVATVVLDDYLLVSLNATYQVTDSLQGYIRVENLLDENYQEVLGFSTPGFGIFAGLRLALGGGG